MLLSEAALSLIGDRLPSAFTVRDLGRYRLKDFDVPQTIFQLNAPGVATDFPRLRLGALALTNLPSHRTSFVGRVREIAELRELLAKYRLVTLVGVGGTGKTRLMLETSVDVLDSQPDGIWLVELSAINAEGLVADEIARVLGVQEQPGRRSIETVGDFLRSKSLLLLLDNCEHLITTAADLPIARNVRRAREERVWLHADAAQWNGSWFASRRPRYSRPQVSEAPRRRARYPRRP